VNRNSTPRKVDKTSPPVANPAVTIESSHEMVAAAIVEEEIVENVKCFLPSVRLAELKPKFHLSPIPQNPFIAGTASKNLATVELK